MKKTFDTICALGILCMFTSCSVGKVEYESYTKTGAIKRKLKVEDVSILEKSKSEYVSRDGEKSTRYSTGKNQIGIIAIPAQIGLAEQVVTSTPSIIDNIIK